VSAAGLSSHRIRVLNDAVRCAGPAGSGQWVLTRGVAERGEGFAHLAIRAVQTFDGFTPDNDPYGEHDFGSFNLAGETMFWKIDYYDRNLEFGAEDPGHPDRSRRVITVMLASEY
jgi:hypothetical protein